jgi:Domain of unknown function (DUF932)
MYSTHTESRAHLATRFARNTRVVRADAPLTEDQMRAAAPSVFAEGKHASRSERYTYIPTIDVLRGLRKEGFEPFMVAQGASRIEGKAEFTKHMIRMRHAGQVQTRPEANEIILINSHDGASSYQMLAGMFRLCRDVHRRHYVPRRTMSTRATSALRQLPSIEGHSACATTGRSRTRATCRRADIDRPWLRAVLSSRAPSPSVRDWPPGTSASSRSTRVPATAR